MSKISHTITYDFKNYVNTKINIMEVCGTHTMSIFKHGIRDLLPDNINLISGPGCPVCVTSQSYIDNAIEISKKRDSIVATFGDMIKVSGNNTSLEEQKARGYDIRIIYSPLDCIKIAKENPNKKVVFLAVGFETTSPIIALTVKKAKELSLTNFYVYCGMKLIIPALEMLCLDEDLNIDGFMLPGHVSAIIGQRYYKFIPNEYDKACVITGFESNEILSAIKMIVQQIINKNFKVENAYRSVVRDNGNIKAFNTIFEVFEANDDYWRGIGKIDKSGLKLKDKYKNFDAANYYHLKENKISEIKGCICGEIIKGKKNPHNCKLFGAKCTPLTAVGPCMVSSEGVCAAYYKYNSK